MQKVISALEHLEQFAASSDSEKDTIECLQKTVTHLELEEAKKIEERQRNDLELQQIEEHYKQETRYGFYRDCYATKFGKCGKQNGNVRCNHFTKGKKYYVWCLFVQFNFSDKSY